jgi:hypothetical protein
LLIEFLKSYICTFETAQESNKLPPGMDKDFQLIQRSLDFMRKHLTASEYKRSIQEINTAVASSVKSALKLEGNITYDLEKKLAAHSMGRAARVCPAKCVSSRS